MADLFDPIWATDGEVYVPSEAEVRAGFTCGSVSPYLFNYLFQTIESTINALDTEGMVPISRTITTTEGIQGGGTLAADRTFRLDFDGLETQTGIENADWFAFERDGQHYKITRANMVAGLGGGSSLTAVENVGDGDGEIFSALSGGDTIQLRTIAVGDGLEVVTSGDLVTISFADLPSELTVE